MTLLQPGDRDLLVAALGTPEAAVAAWSRWRRHHSIDAATWPQARVFTLVGHRLRSAGAADGDLDRLRGTQRHAWAKSVAMEREASEAGATLAARGVQSMVLKGVGLQFAYPEPGLRVMGDADLLVPESQAGAALTALRDAGWDTGLIGAEPWKHLLADQKGTATVRNGWELDVHWRPLHHLAAGLDGPLWEHSVERSLHGRTLRLPHPSHQLVVVLSHGLRDGSGSVLQGLCDAMMLIRTGECDAAMSVDLARSWQRLTALRLGVTLLEQIAPEDTVRSFAAAVRAAGRPNWRDALAQRARSMTPGRLSSALSRLAMESGAAVATEEHEVICLAPGEVARMNDPAVAPALTRGGWSGIEKWGQWTIGGRAVLEFLIDAPAEHTTWPVTFCVHSHLGRRGRQRVTVLINGRRSAVWRWRGDAASRREMIPLPVRAPLEIEFRIRHLAPMGPIDRRLLGLALQWIRVERSATAGGVTYPGDARAARRR